MKITAEDQAFFTRMTQTILAEVRPPNFLTDRSGHLLDALVHLNLALASLKKAEAEEPIP